MSGFKGTFVTPLTEVSTTDKEGLGALRFEGNKCYKYVQYVEATAATDGVAGEVAYYLAAAGDGALEGYALHKVTSDLSDSAEVGAGVLQANMSNLEYGWIQIKGAATLSIALTAGADGDPLTPTGSADGTLDVATAATDVIGAYASDISDKTIICNFPF